MRFKLLALAAILFTPFIASAAAPRTFQELAYYIVTILDTASGILIVAGLVVYFFGISTNLWKTGGESSQNLKMQLLWGILVLFIMVSIWGILQLLQNTLFLTNSYSPTTGEITSPAFGETPSFR